MNSDETRPGWQCQCLLFHVGGEKKRLDVVQPLSGAKEQLPVLIGRTVLLGHLSL